MDMAGVAERAQIRQLGHVVLDTAALLEAASAADATLTFASDDGTALQTEVRALSSPRTRPRGAGCGGRRAR